MAGYSSRCFLLPIAIGMEPWWRSSTLVCRVYNSSLFANNQIWILSLLVVSHRFFFYYQEFGKMLRCFFDMTCMNVYHLKRLKSQAIYWAKAEASWFCSCIRYPGMPRHIPECMNFKHMFSKQYSYTYVSYSLINKIQNPKQKHQNYTPLKIQMEPTNHPFRKENDLPNLYDNVPC